jgi:hypothetical protein
VPDSSLVSFDASFASRIIFLVRPTGSIRNRIEFQFAPKIVSESNIAIFEEENQLSFHPLRLLAGMSGRQINMEWEYIATDKKFNAIKIASEIRKLKSYFYEFSKLNPLDVPIATIKYMEIIPVLTNFIIKDLSITYGQEIIDNGNVYPLYTKVAVTLALMTNMANEDNPNAQYGPPLERLQAPSQF